MLRLFAVEKWTFLSGVSLLRFLVMTYIYIHTIHCGFHLRCFLLFYSGSTSCLCPWTIQTAWRRTWGSCWWTWVCHSEMETAKEAMYGNLPYIFTACYLAVGIRVMHCIYYTLHKFLPNMSVPLTTVSFCFAPNMHAPVGSGGPKNENEVLG